MKIFAAVLWILCAAFVAVMMQIGADTPQPWDTKPAVMMGGAIGFILGTTVIWGVLMAPAVAIRALTKKG